MVKRKNIILLLYLSILMKSKDMIPTVLVIAGSDPTGGAGIQADLKALSGLGVYGAAAITCITVQNSQGVSRIEPLPPDLVQQQVEAVLADHLVTHIKIGMVGSLEIAKILGEIVQTFSGEIIYDPVMAASTGDDLMATGALAEIQQNLLPGITVLTPNIPELALLTGIKVTGKKEIQQAAKVLFGQYPKLKCIVAKGGHGRARNGLLTDYCFLRHENKEITHEKISSINTHGTGCTLASAFCAYHVKTDSYFTSFTQTIKYVQRLLFTSSQHTVVRSSTGRGPMLHAFLQPLESSSRSKGSFSKTSIVTFRQ